MPQDDHRAIALVRLAPGATSSRAGEALDERARDLARVTGPDTHVRCVERISDAPLDGTHFREVLSDFSPWDLAIDVWAPEPDAPAFASFAEVARSLPDVAGGAWSVLRGPQWRASKPPAPLGLAFCLVRKPGLDHAAFVSYWRTEHAMLPLPTLSTFCLFAADPVASAELAARCGLAAGRYDGISEPSYRDVAHLREVSLDPRIRIGARDDERNFVDHATSGIALFRTRWTTPWR
jgi:EthD domain